MSVIIRKCIVKLSNRFNSFPALFFSSSSSISDPILSYLNESGFSAPQIDKMINKHPQILKASPEILKANFKIFHDNGFSTSDTIEIISKHPYITYTGSQNRIGTSIASLKSVLGSTEAVCRVLKKQFLFLKNNLEKTLKPNIEYLTKSCNLSSSDVTDQLISFLMTFLHRPETLAEGARRVDEMGLEWTPKMYLRAVSVVCSLSPATFELKKNVFIGLGFSDRQVLTMFNRCPGVFSSSERKIKETVEVLLSSGRIDRASLAFKATQLILFSLEKRIKPRLEVLTALKERSLLLKQLRLSSVLHMTNKEFLEKFVLSNSKKLGNDFVISISNRLGVIS